MSSLWRNFLRPIVYAVLFVLVFRSFVIEPFRIPSRSMEPTLLVGDFIFVSKFRYGYGPYSMPFARFLFSDYRGRVFGSLPRRGDIAVFRKPSRPSEFYVKRIVALPNDTVRVREGILEINGKRVSRTKIAPALYRETFSNRTSHRIQEVLGDVSEVDNTPLYRVPADHYFFMGDNRDNSLDSRFLSDVGYVPRAYLIGPVVRIWFSVSLSPFKIRWQRMMRSIESIESIEASPHG